MTNAKGLLESFFSETAKEGSKNYFFHCPKCGFHKRKLLVNKETFHWHCWICENTHNTKGRSLYSLFRFFNASQYYINAAEQFEKKRHIPQDEHFGEFSNLFNEVDKKVDDIVKIELPENFTPLYKETFTKHPEYKRAIHYLERRKIRLVDILRYNIGYCIDGDFSKRIIIPSYDKFFRLNYFIARSYHKDTYLTYKNPSVDKTKIIWFESFLNWNLPITIVEGAFDAIPTRYNVTSLLGSTITEEHRLLNEILLKRPPQVNIILDKDALGKAINICEILLNNDIPTKLILLKDDRDPNDLGFEYLWNAIKGAYLLTDTDLMRIRIKYL